MSSLTDNDLHARVHRIVHNTPIVDIHTHLFPPTFNTLFSYGIDDILTYHYLIEDFFCKKRNINPKLFFSKSKEEQARLVWEVLFVENTPLSEACRGVITILEIFKLEGKNYDEIKEFFDAHKNNLNDYTSLIFALTKISHVYMTNNLFDLNEMYYWENNTDVHYKFQSTYRLDVLLDSKKAELILGVMSALHLKSNSVINLSDKYISAVFTYLNSYLDRIKPEYIMLSLSYNIASDEYANLVLTKIIIPYAKQTKLSIFLKLGTDRQANPELQLAGDSLGDVDMGWLRDICKNNPDVRFAVTVLSMNNQHTLAVLCKKFQNLYIYGCWWYCNTPSQIRAITNMRLELLGNTFTFQHSDSRVMEQLLYKWEHSKKILIDILNEKYQDLEQKGYAINDNKIRKDITSLFGHDLLTFLKR